MQHAQEGRCPSWYHFYLESLRAARTRREGDLNHEAFVCLHGRYFAKIRWVAAR